MASETLWSERRGGILGTREPLGPEEARRKELERAMRLLAAGVKPQDILSEMSWRLINKLLHAPLVALQADDRCKR